MDDGLATATIETVRSPEEQDSQSVQLKEANSNTISHQPSLPPTDASPSSADDKPVNNACAESNQRRGGEYELESLSTHSDLNGDAKEVVDDADMLKTKVTPQDRLFPDTLPSEGPRQTCSKEDTEEEHLRKENDAVNTLDASDTSLQNEPVGKVPVDTKCKEESGQMNGEDSVLPLENIDTSRTTSDVATGNVSNCDEQTVNNDEIRTTAENISSPVEQSCTLSAANELRTGAFESDVDLSQNKCDRDMQAMIPTEEEKQPMLRLEGATETADANPGGSSNLNNGMDTKVSVSHNFDDLMQRKESELLNVSGSDEMSRTPTDQTSNDVDDDDSKLPLKNECRSYMDVNTTYTDKIAFKSPPIDIHMNGGSSDNSEVYSPANHSTEHVEETPMVTNSNTSSIGSNLEKINESVREPDDRLAGEDVSAVIPSIEMMNRGIASTNLLKRRASETPLQDESDSRRTTLDGEVQSKQMKMSDETITETAPEPTDVGEITTADPEVINAHQLEPNTHPDNTSRHNSMDSSKSPSSHMLNDFSPDQQPTASKPPCDSTLETANENTAVQESHAENEENSSSSSDSSSSSESSSSSASSSSSSESDDSDDEAEDSQKDNSHKQPTAQNELAATGYQAHQPAPTTATLASIETPEVPNNDSGAESSQDSAAMEIGESGDSYEEDEVDKNREDEAKITRSEGLKLSISLKRSSNVATPTGHTDESVATKSKPTTLAAAASLPPQPVDFSNLLKQGLFNERQELIKIDYNHATLQDHSGRSSTYANNISDHHHQQQQPPLIHPPQHSSQHWSQRSVTTDSVGNNVGSLNHFSDTKATSVSRLLPPTLDESSDTMDEDNRLVIAEKQQRRYRKKASNSSQSSLLQTALATSGKLNAAATVASYNQQLLQLQEQYRQVQRQQALSYPTQIVPSQFMQNFGRIPDDYGGGTYGADATTMAGRVNEFPAYNKITPSMISNSGQQHPPSLFTAASNRSGESRKKSKTKAGTATVPKEPVAHAASPLKKNKASKKVTNDAIIQRQTHQTLATTLTKAANESSPAVPTTTTVQLPLEKKKDKKKVFLCSACGTHYENWNLFVHMLEVHRKHICLYCLGIFQSADRLVNHLGAKHSVTRKHYGGLADYIQHHQRQRIVAKFGESTILPEQLEELVTKATMGHQQSFFLMCSRCEHLFESSGNPLANEEEHIIKHNCADYVETCSNCGELKMSKHRCGVMKGDEDGSGLGLAKKKQSKKMLPKGIHDNNKTLQSVAGRSVADVNGVLTDQNGYPSTAPYYSHEQNQHHGSIPIHGGEMDGFNRPTPMKHTETHHQHEIQRLQDSNVNDHHRTTPSLLLQPAQSSILSSISSREEAVFAEKHATSNGDQYADQPEQNAVPSALLPPSDNSVVDMAKMASESSNPPAIPVTPLVPKLKVKIPIQYMNSIESDESSSDSELEEEEGEEEEDEYDDDEEEDDNDEQEKTTKDDERASDAVVPVAESSSSVSEKYEAPVSVPESSADPASQQFNTEDSLKLDSREPVHVETDSTTLQAMGPIDNEDEKETNEMSSEPQEDVPMDIDESLSGHHHRVQQAQSVEAEPSHRPLQDNLPSSAQDQQHSCTIGEVGVVDRELAEQQNVSTVSMETDPVKDDHTEPTVENVDSQDQQEGATPSELAGIGSPTTSHNDDACEKECKETDVPDESSAAKVLEPATTQAGDDPMDTEESKTTLTDPDGLAIADEDAQLFQLTLDEPLDRIPLREFVKICLRETARFCLYCNHARRIAVNGRQLVVHIIAMHRFQATVNSITGEELLPDTILHRFRSSLNELEGAYLNVETFDNSWSLEQRSSVPFIKQFECFQCRFVTVVHKELYLHNRKMHQKSVLFCLICKANFFSYSELLCHMCPGVSNRMSILDYSFRCCVCNMDGIPSAFRLMVHLRKRHFACDVCLEECQDQARLSNHVWKHKLNHLCYRCGLSYRNKDDILKHLFWKHGTEGVLCKRCLKKKWPHVYHFCSPPAQYTCDVCQLSFERSVALKVHQRLHNGEAKYPCTEDGCEKRFISKKLLLKHVQRHYPEEQRAIAAASESEVKMEDKLDEDNAAVKDAQQEQTNATVTQNGSVGHSVDERSGKEDECTPSDKATEDKEGQSEVNPTNTVKDESGLAETSAILEDSKDEAKAKVMDITDAAVTDSKTASDAAQSQPSITAQANEVNTTPSKKSKKKRKGKDDGMSLDDLMDLPALNLSESDSSDASDNENSNASSASRQFRNWSKSRPADSALAADDRDQDDNADRSVDPSGTELVGLGKKNAAGQWTDEQKSANVDNDETKEGVLGESEGATVSDPIANIWNNFKRYQAHRTISRRQSATVDEEQRQEDELVERMLKNTILHVTQSDHDYSLMYKPLNAEADMSESQDPMARQESLLLKSKDDFGKEKDERHGGKTNSPRRRRAHSSDSDDSSGSDSSCNCGSNCSCSSSSSSSSGSNSSTSSSDSDSSDDNATAATPNKKTTSSRQKKTNGKNRSDGKTDDAKARAELDAQAEEPKPPPEPAEPVDPDSVIVTSDLETDESETDEEFYDENPQKLASQMLAEKRRQLFAQTYNSSANSSLNATNTMNYGIVENSRPSTPSLPPEEQQQQLQQEESGKKKLKMKKRKRERKSSKRQMSPHFAPMSLEAMMTAASTQGPLAAGGSSGGIPDQWVTGAGNYLPHMQGNQSLAMPLQFDGVSIETSASEVPLTPGATVAPYQGMTSGVTDDLAKISTPRLSTGNNSETDAPLKRSQRSRKPNKFYGYTSDDESLAGALPGIPLSTNPEKSILSLMKPTPPPNLVWSKEDLPSPPSKSAKATGTGSRSTQQSTPITSRRNSGIGFSTLDESFSGGMAGLAQQTASQPIAPPSLQAALGAAVLAASASMPSSSSSCLTPDQRPPLPKLKLSLGKKSRTSSTPSAKRSLKGTNKRRTLTPKTPKSAPPMGGGFGSMVPTTPLTAPIATPPALPSTVAMTPGYALPIVPEQHPKLPPIGSFPSVQTEYFRPNQIRVPAGWRPPREGESVYCYCRCPYDEVSEMIACDDENCRIEWFHFECVGIIMPPKGKWYCPECTPKHPPQTDADQPVFNSAPSQRQHPSMAFNANGPAGLAGVPPQPSTTSSLSGLWGSSQP